MVVDVARESRIRDLNAALVQTGLAETDLAEALGVSASRLVAYRSGEVAPSTAFVSWATHVALGLHSATERGWMTSRATAAAVRAALAEQDEMWAFKMMLQGRDHLHALLQERPSLGGSWEAAPGSTGADQWDVMLAAVAAHEFTFVGLSAPAWTIGAVLSTPWILDSPRLTPTEVRARTPAWLAERGVFVCERDLGTA